MNSVKALTILLDIKGVLDGMEIPFWLDGGTLLGAYRENGFMSSDFDIDIGIKAENFTPKIIGALKDRGFRSFHLKEHPCSMGKQISWIKDDIPGDIFVYYKRGDKRWRLMFDIDPTGVVRFIPCVCPAYFFDKFETIDFMDYGVEFQMPSPTAEYLEHQYGDWETDKPKSEFHWQTGYKSMDMGFEIFPEPKGKRRWILTDKFPSSKSDGSFFIPFIKEGFKLYPIVINENMDVIDGRKRLAAYQKLGVPMVECICTEAH